MSSLHEALSEYLQMRRALGTQLRWPESSLRKFVDCLETEGLEFITTEIALRWATEPVGVQRATHARRLGIVRGFAIWLQATDDRTQVPPRGLLPARQRRPNPYIYSDREISNLMAAARRLRSVSGLRSLSYETLLGLLAATGLRPGEALALEAGDVDLIGGVIAVRDSKFGKSRVVPLHESARAALVEYAKVRTRVQPFHDPQAFLVDDRGSRLCGSTTRRTFAKLCQSTGIRPDVAPHVKRSGPRLQDFRHTFATRRLIEWYRAGLDIERLMPRLATYLGHARVAQTYWYIQAVPELLRLATERLGHAARGEVQ